MRWRVLLHYPVYPVRRCCSLTLYSAPSQHLRGSISALTLIPLLVVTRLHHLPQLALLLREKVRGRIKLPRPTRLIGKWLVVDVPASPMSLYHDLRLRREFKYTPLNMDMLCLRPSCAPKEREDGVQGVLKRLLDTSRLSPARQVDRCRRVRTNCVVALKKLPSCE